MPLHEYIAELSGNKGITLPVPQMNVMNGGKHAGLEEDIQEQMIAATGAKSYGEALQASVETYHALKGMLKKKYGAQAVLLGDEGGFSPKIEGVEERLELMLKAVEEAGYSGKIKIALDPASSEFFAEGKYSIGSRAFSSAELADYYARLSEKFSIVSIEDGMAEDDWQGWAGLNKKLGKKLQIVGDDLLVTNVERIRKAVELKACNALLLKLNQIGTVTESVSAWKLAVKNNWNVVVSHRSGETEDSFIADLVVGLGAGQSKFGAPARSERTAKYNQLLRIEEKLLEKGNKPVFGGSVFKANN